LLLSWVFQAVSFLLFPHQNPVFPSPLPIAPPCPINRILDFITWKKFGEQYRFLSSTDH
jgi:hypothetical protein